VHETSDDDFRLAREAMVATQIAARGINDTAILAAFRVVPRHVFVPAAQRHEAYRDHPVPIGFGQTISQPYIVALMTSLVHPKRGSTILEIGCGSGYQSAILAELGCQVVALEILEPLADRAALTLASLGYEGVQVLCRDGRAGLPELAPAGGYAGVLVAAAATTVPEELVRQLALGARLVIPIGEAFGYQELVTIERRRDGLVREHVLDVRFVPLIGPAAG